MGRFAFYRGVGERASAYPLCRPSGFWLAVERRAKNSSIAALILGSSRLTAIDVTPADGSRASVAIRSSPRESAASRRWRAWRGSVCVRLGMAVLFGLDVCEHAGVAVNAALGHGGVFWIELDQD